MSDRTYVYVTIKEGLWHYIKRYRERHAKLPKAILLTSIQYHALRNDYTGLHMMDAVDSFMGIPILIADEIITLPDSGSKEMK